MLAFMHIRKTGGLTMRAILRKNFGIKNCDCPINDVIRLEDWEWVKRCYPTLVSLQGHSVRVGTEFEQVFPNPRFFTIIRNPIARCISHYQHAATHGVKPVLKDWIPSVANELCKAICGEANSNRAIEVMENKIGFVGLTESYNESMLLWRNWTGFPDLDLTYMSKNVASSSAAKSELKNDPEAMELIQSHHIEDKKLFDYVCQTVYPRQKAEYGDSLAADLSEYEQQLSRASNLSLPALLGCLKRHLVYKRGLRDWRAELQKPHKRVA